MTDIQVRGYALSAAVKYMQEVGGANGEHALQTLPEASRKAIASLSPAQWYPVSVLADLHRATVASMANNDEEEAKKVLTACGRFMAREATNTFLRLLMRMLTPTMLAAKFPDLWRRDFSGGRADIQVDERKMVCRYFDLPGFVHQGVVGCGFVSFTLEAMGKSIEKTTFLDWSLDQPNVDGTGFELIWKG